MANTDPQLPSHASPALLPKSYADSHNAEYLPTRALGELSLTSDEPLTAHPSETDQSNQNGPPPPPSLISPAFTPPSTPGRETPMLERPPRSVPVDTSKNTEAGPALVEELPEVSCIVRARIPTTTGQEMWLHVYKNSVDTKEHLAIVFGGNIRSHSLDAAQPGETEWDRMVRGAYIGRLHPGRTSSKLEGESVEGERVRQELLKVESPLVRIHSECYTGETVWSARCDCGEQLDEAARLMSSARTAPAGGVIIYLRQEGRGIGLSEKLKAYNLQDLGKDTYEANILLRHPADARSYGLATAMLQDLGLGGDRGIRLLTNNPDKVRAVEGPNREVVVKERVAMVPLAWKTGGQRGINSEEVEKYLSTKVCVNQTCIVLSNLTKAINSTMSVRNRIPITRRTLTRPCLQIEKFKHMLSQPS